jgi:hypothetical protein
VPKPPLVFLLADETPHFINFRGRDFSVMFQTWLLHRNPKFVSVNE